MSQVSLVPPDCTSVGVEPGPPGEQAVHHPAPDSNGFIFWLDEPQSWRTTSRWLRLAGWCLHVSGAPVTSMRAKIGKREFVIPLQISRPDVIDYFGRWPENERCGFSLDVRMPRRQRLLTVEAQIHESPWRTGMAATVHGPLFARPGERRRRQERGRAAVVQRYSWWYDRPTDWDASTRILYVSGWFIDTMGLPVPGIRARIGRQLFPANVNLPREDLLVTHPDLPLARRSGFTLAIPLPRGTSRIVLQYQGTDRVWRDFDSHRVRRGDRQAELPPPSELPFFTPSPAFSSRFFSWVLQHGGVILGVGGVASHIDGIRRHEPGYFARQHLAQDFCAVTAACLMVRREVFERLGGFDEVHLPITFIDVDFCLRARELGWHIVYSPYAELIHHESISRGIENTTEKQRHFFKESEFLLNRWSALIQNDPAHNSNLSLAEKRFKLAFLPRVTPPWKKSQLAQATP